MRKTLLVLFALTLFASVEKTEAQSKYMYFTEPQPCLDAFASGDIQIYEPSVFTGAWRNPVDGVTIKKAPLPAPACVEMKTVNGQKWVGQMPTKLIGTAQEAPNYFRWFVNPDGSIDFNRPSARDDCGNKTPAIVYVPHQQEAPPPPAAPTGDFVTKRELHEAIEGFAQELEFPEPCEEYNTRGFFLHHKWEKCPGEEAKVVDRALNGWVVPALVVAGAATGGALAPLACVTIVSGAGAGALAGAAVAGASNVVVEDVPVSTQTHTDMQHDQ